MKFTSGLAVLIVIVVLIVVGFLYFEFAPHAAAPGVASSTPISTVMYSCDEGTLTAQYASTSVMVMLSDGQMYTLPQTISGSGIRYESTSTPGTDIVFASEGANAFVQENGSMTYSNCVANTGDTGTASSSASGTSTFKDQGNTFTFTYPSQFTVSGGGVGYSQDWMVNATSSGMVLAKLTIPGSFEPKTNFGDATLTIGTSADPTALAECTTYAQSGGGAPQKSTVTINGVTYTKFVTNDAGAGNIYQTTSYRTIRNSQCYAIEYTIHSSNIDNYDPSQGITAFDQTTVQNLLEGIVHSFMFLAS